MSSLHKGACTAADNHAQLITVHVAVSMSSCTSASAVLSQTTTIQQHTTHTLLLPVQHTHCSIKTKREVTWHTDPGIQAGTERPWHCALNPDATLLLRGVHPDRVAPGPRPCSECSGTPVPAILLSDRWGTCPSATDLTHRCRDPHTAMIAPSHASQR